jgi:hypothetical protein
LVRVSRRVGDYRYLSTSLAHQKLSNIFPKTIIFIKKIGQDHILLLLLFSSTLFKSLSLFTPFFQKE